MFSRTWTGPFQVVRKSVPTKEHVSLRYWVLRLRTENFFSENFLTQKSFSQSEERTMFFTSEKNSSSNQSSEQCFFPREKKNGTSNQKPQRCLGFASKCLPLGACSVLAFLVSSQSRYLNRISSFQFVYNIVTDKSCR